MANPNFQKRHYEMIAAAIRESHGRAHGAEAQGLENHARDMARAFKRDNPNFRESQFLKACGMRESA